MRIEPFYDPATFTLTYLVFDPESGDAVVIDPVLDYDPATRTSSTVSVEKVARVVDEKGLRLRWILETHAHADHLSASQWLKQRYGARIAIGERIVEVQAMLARVLEVTSLATDGRQFDRLLADGERLRAGTLVFEAIATPGHTPACMTYRIGDAIFTGDALFVEDYGTGRCDFPGGSAAALYASVHDRLYALPDETRVFVGHDYRPGGRALRFETTIGTSKKENVQLRATTALADFVDARNARDATLAAPRLFGPSVRANIEAGRVPVPMTKVEDVPPARVAELIGKVHVVDVRNPEELRDELGHIAGVDAVPLPRVEAAAREWDIESPVGLVCRSGGRSARAAAALAAMGFRRVMNMTGGMQAWNAAGLPTTR